MEHLFTKDGFDIYFEDMTEFHCIEDALNFQETGVDHSDTIKKS